MPSFVGQQIRSWYRSKTSTAAPIEVVKTYLKGGVRYVTCRANDVVLFDMPYDELQRDYVRFDKK